MKKIMLMDKFVIMKKRNWMNTHTHTHTHTHTYTTDKQINIKKKTYERTEYYKKKTN